MTTTPEPTKGVPLIVGNPSFTPRADHNSLGEYLRDRLDETVATSSSLPPTGNWVGRKIRASNTGITHEWDGSAWIPLPRLEDTGWITASLTGSLAHESGNPLQYRRRNGIVFFRGRLSTGSISSGATIFTLPVGFRPDGSAGAVNVFYADSNGPTRINIPTNTGVITLLGAAAAGNFTIPFSFIAAV